MLNKALSYFDEIEYYYSLGIIDDKSLIYFAAEILNFNNNETVMKYVKDTEIKYKKMDYPPDITPFSGFTTLVEKIQENKKIGKLNVSST
jgi:hypothetical protein